MTLETSKRSCTRLETGISTRKVSQGSRQEAALTLILLKQKIRALALLNQARIEVRLALDILLSYLIH